MDEAPTTQAVSAPLPPELRPYIVLHAENASLPNGSHFGGHWVSAWRCKLPFVQIDRARSHPVGRCVPFAGDGDPAAMAALLRDAACLIAADETWLEAAATAGTKTIYLADGHPDRVALPEALRNFRADNLHVLRSGTNFRRDLPLRLINEALEHFVPGVTGEDRSESSLCRARLQPYMHGRIADLGHGGHKVHPDAVGVDFFKFDETDWIGDVRDLWFFGSDSFDSVYSSHCLEDLWHPHQALAEWTRILKPGGHLSLFLPLRDFYPNVGTPGANPGHKDDYVPEDVEQFLRELGHCEIVHSARVERENSFELVAKKKARRSFFVMRETRPTPQVSVLVVADPSTDANADATAICATVATAQAALAGCEHEVLVLDRTRCDGDHRAAVRDLAARDARVHVVEDRRPLPYTQRWEQLRRLARGETLLVLQPGTMLAPGAGDRLREAIVSGAAAALPLASDPQGRVHAAGDAARSCLMLPSASWPIGALEQSPYTTDQLWHDVAQRLAAAAVDGARAITAGQRGRPLAARGRARRLFDARLGGAGVDPMRSAAPQRILVVMLRTLGDCVLATPVLDALRRRHPDARIEVLTERPYAWIFAQHDAVDAVLTADGLPAEQFALAEDRAVTTALEHGDYDRLVLLSDRLENVTYHHSGLSLADFYAVQAGVPEACGMPPRFGLADAARAAWGERRRQLGVSGRYAVVHTRAGWADKSPPAALVERIADELARAGLVPVVIGGNGERIEHAAAVNLAGELGMAESAAVIAEAELFVGPDSGPLHIASAMGVRSLALFGGSHLRVAPPRAKGSCSVQAATCCPVPCGVTPCPERHCGAKGLTSDAVLPRLQAVIDDHVGEQNEFWGREPALCVSSADGPVLVGSAEQQFAGTPSPQLDAVTDRVAAHGRAAPAPQRALPVELGMFALEQHARQLLAAPATVGTAADTPQVLEALRNGVAPELGLDVVRTLGTQCQMVEDGNGMLQMIAAAIAHCGAMMRGQRGRPRPAFRLHAVDMLHRALHVALPEPSGSRLRDQLFTLYEAEIGEQPDREHVIHAIAMLDEKHLEPCFAARLHGLLLARLQGHEAHHMQVLRQASLLRKLGDLPTAIELLERHLAALPPQALRHVAEVRFLRGTFLVAAGDAGQALDDMRFAVTSLSSDNDRHTAAQIVTRLERHLGAPIASA
ncbi:MAG: glycosyltransferase family 9 protein [Planctomycetota bacterium]